MASTPSIIDASDPIAATLFSVVAAERLARDTADWSAMELAYWPGAHVRVTWFDGPVEDFIRASRESVRPGVIGGFHEIVPVRAEVSDSRALVESRGRILLRPRVDDVECDLTSWCRFVAGLERREGEWRMTFFDSIYVKDRIDSVVPGDVVPVDRERWETYRPSYRWLAYTNHARGIPVPSELPGADRPDLIDNFWRAARAWLSGGSLRL